MSAAHIAQPGDGVVLHCRSREKPSEGYHTHIHHSILATAAAADAAAASPYIHTTGRSFTQWCSPRELVRAREHVECQHTHSEILIRQNETK